MLKINLLPPKEKENILFEKKKRLIFFLSGFFVFTMFIFSVLLLPSLISAYFQVDAVKGRIAVEKSLSETKKAQALEDNINQISKLIYDLDRARQETKSVFPFLISLSNDLIAGSRLIDFSFKQENNEISIRGFAPDRDSFIALKNNIENDKNFKGLISPLSNIIKEKNIEFILTFYLN